MCRVLFARELGDNFGHIARDLLLPLACIEDGHDVSFAVTARKLELRFSSWAPFRMDAVSTRTAESA